jgi:hypothetical protein
MSMHKPTSAVLGIALAMIAAPAAAQPTAPAVQAQPQTAVAFRNQLPGSFRLNRVRLWVDGALRYDAPRPGSVTLLPGQHVVAVSAEYRLSDPVFTYMSGYRVEVHSAERVSAPTASRSVVARAVEAGGVTTPIGRRAQIVWR